MAIINTTTHIPETAHRGIENIANSNSESKPNSQEFETIQVQKTRDHPEEIKLETAKPEAEKKPIHPIEEFLSKKVILWTTLSSILINMLSAPIHLFKNNPIKDIINKVSMVFTKMHLLAYSANGLFCARRQKNPLLIFSFFTEGVAAFIGLRNNYLFRGIATGIDGAVTGIKGKYKKSEFSSYAEGWQHSWNAIKITFKDFATKFIKDPMHITRLDGADIAIFASLLAAAGGLFGMTVHEKVGGTVRDVSGGFGDVGILKLNNPLAQKCGFFALGGTILDLAARVFNKGIAAVLGVKNPEVFERLRDAFHEFAIASDRAGQFYFMRYNEQTDQSLQTATVDPNKSYLDFIKLKKKTAPEPNPGVELAKARNYATAA